MNIKALRRSRRKPEVVVSGVPLSVAAKAAEAESVAVPLIRVSETTWEVSEYNNDIENSVINRIKDTITDKLCSDHVDFSIRTSIDNEII